MLTLQLQLAKIARSHFDYTEDQDKLHWTVENKDNLKQVQPILLYWPNWVVTLTITRCDLHTIGGNKFNLSTELRTPRDKALTRDPGIAECYYPAPSRDT